MATISDFEFINTDRPLAPVSTDAGPVALNTAKRFGPFPSGTRLIVGSTMRFHCVCGDGTVVATTSNPDFVAGKYPMMMPDGCTYISLIDSSDGAGVGAAYQG